MAGMIGNIWLLSSGVEYAIFIVGTIATFFFIDKTGRRPLLVSISYLIFASLTDPDIRCTLHARLHVRRRWRSWKLWNISPRWTQWEFECESQSYRCTRTYCDSVLLSTYAYVRSYSSSHCMGLCSRGLVFGNSRNWHGT
jgi:hypothetical protein